MSEKTLKPWMAEAFKEEADEKGMFKTSKRLEQFGENQNEYNKLVYETIEDLKKRIVALETEQERFVTLLKRCGNELVNINKEIDHLKLSSKLNTNSIKRIVGDIEAMCGDKTENTEKKEDKEEKVCANNSSE